MFYGVFARANNNPSSESQQSKIEKSIHVIYFGLWILLIFGAVIVIVVIFSDHFGKALLSIV